MKCFASAEGFITTNGGGILTCYFDKKVLFYVPHGKELRDGYLTKENFMSINCLMLKFMLSWIKETKTIIQKY